MYNICITHHYNLKRSKTTRQEKGDNTMWSYSLLHRLRQHEYTIPGVLVNIMSPSSAITADLKIIYFGNLVQVQVYLPFLPSLDLWCWYHLRALDSLEQGHVQQASNNEETSLQAVQQGHPWCSTVPLFELAEWRQTTTFNGCTGNL